MLKAEYSIKLYKNFVCWCLELLLSSGFLNSVWCFLSLGRTDSSQQFAPKSAILCSLLYRAKNPLTCSNRVCLARKPFMIHSSYGLHMCLSLPGETEVFYIWKYSLLSMPFNKIKFYFITYEAGKASYLKTIKCTISFWEDTFLASCVS